MKKGITKQELGIDVIEDLNKIGNLSTLEKEIIDNLKNEDKELNITNAINYLCQNNKGGNNDNDGSIKLGTIENLTAISDLEGTKAILKWQNPTIIEFQKVEIYVSTQDLTSANYDYCTKNATKIVDSKIDTFEFKASNNITFYFKAFAVYNIFGILQNSDGIVTSVKVIDTKPPAIVTNIKATTGNGEITLAWTNPNDKDFAKVKIVRKENNNPTDIKDGIVVYEGNNITYKDTSLSNGTNYYYRFFTYDTNNNVNDTDIQIINVTPIANGYDKPISNFIAKAGNEEVTLSWIYPADANFSTVKIRRKENGYPTGIDDGDLVCECFYAYSPEYPEEYITDYDIDSNLTNGVKYYYRAFTFNKDNQYCDIEDGQQVTATPQAFKEYGVRWTKSTDTVERLGDAVGLTAITGGKNDFNNLMPWMGMKRCNLSDSGVVNAYYGSPIYKVDGSNGQCMVEIPKFWFKIVAKNSDVIEFWICNGAKDGYEIHPAFFRDRKHLCDDNSGVAEEVDYRYIGAYEATEYTSSDYRGNDGAIDKTSSYVSSYILSSISGLYPIVNRTLKEFRNLAKNRGKGWSQQDYYITYAIQMLYFVEYANFNSQKTIGNGNLMTDTNGFTLLKTGMTDSYGNNSYGVTYNSSSAISYRGIENLYGNTSKWLEGIETKNMSMCFKNKGFNGWTDNFEKTIPTGLRENVQGYGSSLFGNNTLGFIPNVFEGSATTGLCDRVQLGGSYPAFFGKQKYFDNGESGIFFLQMNTNADSRNEYISARLAY
ncbi:uncharacterized protein CBO05P1_152 [Clostridium botulinum B str. Osaka05]|uniref:Fibronectin type-III domain-containing protein n=1 Tax=Clostridium botulinum B str. Osaka05 TaxID=1407017 RepID=A0A060N357_CLOBO|nr:hypothetical protein [Clostridium botulinum]BAO04871.1 uncharacterized protein CBO05P1_152 [Clostridium botulinum B str. Osaka05]